MILLNEINNRFELTPARTPNESMMRFSWLLKLESVEVYVPIDITMSAVVDAIAA